MNQSNVNTKTKSLDATPNGGTMQLHVGPMLRGPKRCIKCNLKFKHGEAWRRYTSPSDPELGTYSIGVHEKCSGK